MTDDSDISTKSVSEYVEFVEELTEKFPQMDEQNTRTKIVNRFLKLLGWDLDFDAELEYPVTMGSSDKYIDYALTVDSSSPVLFVEAKGFDSSITENNRKQLSSYLRQTNVNWGLLTNGQRYEIYRREIINEGVSVEPVAKIDLVELPDYLDHVRLLSREALKSGRSKEIAQEIFEFRRAKENLQENKEDIALRITEELTNSVGDVVSQPAETEAKELIDRLVDRIEGRTEPELEVDRSTEIDSFWQRVERETGITRTDDSIEFVQGNTATQDFVNFVEFLFENDYLSREDLPIESGSVRYLLNTEDRHKSGDEMYNSKLITDGVYLEAHNSTSDKKRYILKLGERVRTSGS